MTREWEDHIKAEEEANLPSDADRLEQLDAYGHLTWTVGYDNKDGDWLACFDFHVFICPDRDVMVAYEVVVNSDSGGFIEGISSGIVPPDKAPYNLPEYWCDIGLSHGPSHWSDQDLTDALHTNAKWNEALKKAIEKAQKILDLGEEIPDELA